MSGNLRWICLSTFYCFSLLFLLFIPFPFRFFPFQAPIAEFLFSDLILWIANGFGWDINAISGFSSDSTSMYFLSGFLGLVACLLACFGHLLSWSFLKKPAFYAWIDRLFIAYLSLIWFRYGFDKVFKHQFYLPEPNILFTPFGKLDPDILFWSLIGTSYSYNLVLGGVELLAGTFLLFHRTRLAGLLLSMIILFQILVINLCFDISLKLFSCFLLLVVFLLLRTKAKSLYLFLFKNQFHYSEAERLSWPQGWVKLVLKTGFVFLLLFEGTYPFITSGNLNDDLAARPYLHGAYEVVRPLNPNFPVKRFFVHREGYLIFQMENDEMEDFRLLTDPSIKELTCTDYDGRIWRFSYEVSLDGQTIKMVSLDPNRLLELEAKAMDWRELPALNPSFHWTMEGHFSDSTKD